MGDAHRRVVLFLYDEQQNPIPEIIRPMIPNRMTGSWITLPTDALLAAYPSIDVTAMGFL